MEERRPELPTHLRLKVHAEAKAEKLVDKGSDRFEIWVRAPAEAGRANKAVLSLLAAHLGIPSGRLWIIKGAHQPTKIIAIKPPR